MTGNQGDSQLRRRFARLVAAGAVASLALAGVGTVAAQEPAPEAPDVFRSSASAQAVSAFLDREALLPVDDAFRFVAVDGVGTYESSNQTARASLLYPGNGVISGPSLACGTFGGQFPPQFAPVLEACSQFRYPLTVFADSLAPDGQTQGSVELGAPTDPVSARALRAVAHAALDASTTDVAMADVRVLGFPAAGPTGLPAPLPGGDDLDDTVVVIQSAVSETTQTIDEAGRLVVRSESVLDGVRLLGGLVRIGTIHSTSRILDDGQGGKERDAALTVQDVTVAGLPARITDEGLVLGSPTGAEGPLRQQLTGPVRELLAQLGVRITTLDVEHGTDDSGLAFARSGGVMVEFDVDVQGVPVLPGPQGDVDPNGLYTGVIVLGETGASGLAAHIEDPVFTPGDPSGPIPDIASGLGGAGSVGGSLSPADAGVDDLVVAGGDEAAGPAPASDGRRIVSIGEVLAAGRVELVYLAFTLLTLAVCLGPRFVLPARFSGSTT